MSLDLETLAQIAQEDPEYAARIARDYRKAMVVLARQDPSWFCQYVLRNERDGAMIRQSPTHVQMHQHVLANNRSLIWTFPGCGKCLATGTPILLRDGTWAAVETLSDWTEAWTWDGRSPDLVPITLRSADNGMQRCVRVELDNGCVVVTTDEHPFMNDAFGWTPAARLKAGDRVVCVRKTPAGSQTPEHEIPGDEAEILGYLLAGRAQRKNVVVRKILKNEKWDRRRRELFAAAGWVLSEHGELALKVRPEDCAASPSEFLATWAVLEHGWPVDLRPAVWNLSDRSLERLLSAFMAAAFVSRRRYGYTVGLGADRVPVGLVHVNRATLDLIRRLMLRVGVSATIERPDSNVPGRGIWIDQGKVCRAQWRLRVPNAEAGRFWPTYARLKVEAPVWEFRTVVKAAPTVQKLQTWSVEVREKEHSFIAGGVVTHNTNQLSIGHVLWRLGRDPNTTIGILCNSGKMATKILSALKTYIQESLELRDVFPNLKPGEKWAEYSFTVDRTTIRKDPTVQAIGLTGKFVGSRFGGLIMDDVDNVDTTLTPELRDSTESKVRRQALSRLDDDGWAVAVGNVWDEKDLMHRLEKTGWKGLRFPVMDEVTGASNDPENFPLERIYEIRDVDQGPIEFQRLYQLKARIAGEQRFRQEWIDVALGKGRQQVLCTEGLPKVPGGCRTITGVDLGVKKKASSDPTAITTILEIPAGGDRVEYQLLNTIKGRWDAQEIMDHITTQQRFFGSLVYVESNGCFVPGTRVLTPEGYRPIETVEPGTLVWTHAGRWRPVLSRYDGTARHITPVRAVGSLSVSCTPNHAFYVRQAGRTPGRKGGHHRPLDPKGWCSAGFPDVPLYLGLATPSWPALDPILSLEATQKLSARSIPVDDGLALVLGLFMAEGHSTKGQVFWTLNKNETHLADLIERVLMPLGFRPSRRVYRSTLRVIVSSKQLAGALHVGSRDSKCLPLVWMGWPLPLRLALVRGWLLGDGSVNANGDRGQLPSRSLGGQTISRDWALFVRSTLHQAGIPVALRETSARKTSVIEGRTVKRRPAFLLNLTQAGSEVLRRSMSDEAEATHWTPRWWRHALPNARKAGCPTVLQEDGAWARMRPHDPDASKTYQAWEDGPVHNLVVAEDESYTVEDFVVHNAQDFLVQLLNMNGSRIPVRAFHTGRNKFDPMFGVESIAGEMATGVWTLPAWDGDLDSAEEAVEHLVQEMLAYTPGNHTGDVLMSLWIAREGARNSRLVTKDKPEFGRLRLRR